MVLSNSRALRKVGGHKNKGYLVGMDFDLDESSDLIQAAGEAVFIPRYEELTYLRLEDGEE